MSDCTIGKELKQSTCRYVKNCKPGYTRNDKFICRKTSRRVAKKNSVNSVNSLKFEVQQYPESEKTINPMLNYGSSSGEYMEDAKKRVNFKVSPQMSRSKKIIKKKTTKPGKLGSRKTRNSYNMALLKQNKLNMSLNHMDRYKNEDSEEPAWPNQEMPVPFRQPRKSSVPRARKTPKGVKPVTEWKGPGFSYDEKTNTIGKATPFPKEPRKSPAPRARKTPKKALKPVAEWKGPGFSYDEKTNTIGKATPFPKEPRKTPARKKALKPVPEWKGPGFSYDEKTNTIGKATPFPKEPRKTPARKKALKPVPEWKGPGFSYDENTNTIGKATPFPKEYRKRK